MANLQFYFDKCNTKFDGNVISVAYRDLIMTSLQVL